MSILTKPDYPQFVITIRKRLFPQLFEASSSICWADILIFSLIFGFGILQFFSAQRAGDFLSDDVFFADAARSVAEHGFYGMNGYAETNMPPGLSAILAVLLVVGGGSHVAFLRFMAVFGTLGLLASYQLLRLQLPRIVAGAFCLLLISSPINFDLTNPVGFPLLPLHLHHPVRVVGRQEIRGGETTQLAYLVGSSANGSYWSFPDVRLSRDGVLGCDCCGYEFIYLLWPWNLESRLFLPVAPLACVYLWRGGKELFSLAKEKPRLLGAVWFPIAVLLTASAWFWVRGSGIGKQLPNAGLQDETSFLVWLSTAVVATWMVKSDTAGLTSVATFVRRLSAPIRTRGISLVQFCRF
jgi:hypothetical protein